MGAQRLKVGSKGKLVTMLQKFLNLKGKLPKPIPESGEFGPETKEAVRYFQKKANLTVEVDGTVGPETAGALAKLVGPTAASFAKAFGDSEEVAEAKKAEDKKEDDKKSASNAGRTTTGAAAGKHGKHGNIEIESGGYLISIPPGPTGTFPLVVLFAGTTHIPPVFDGTPASYFKKAILVFSESSGSFSKAQSALNPLLAQNQTNIGSVSICGYSLGGQAAFGNYGHATKGVGLIDPTTYNKDLAKLDAKAVFSCNPDNWSEPKYATIVAAQLAAGTAGKAGVYEKTSIKHGVYPKYFLSKFESALL
ncbi:MAG: peptidoglycan-binding domain-containing protein [Verrucomicrobiota bacterium]